MSDKFHVDLDDIAKRNPKVDLGKLEESRRVQRELKEAGYEKKGFQLTMPFERVQTLGTLHETRVRREMTMIVE